MSFYCPIAGSIESLVVKFADGGPKKRQQSQQNHGITISIYLYPTILFSKVMCQEANYLLIIYWAWGMTYCFSSRNDVVLGAIYTIPEWISSSIYFSVFVDIIPKWQSFSYKSFCNEFILVFNPHEILDLVRNFIRVSMQGETNLFPVWKSQIV